MSTQVVDAELSESLAVANIPTLLMVLVQLTGDLTWLEDPYTPTRAAGLGDNDDAGLSPELQAEVRDASYAAIANWRETGEVALPRPDDELLVRMLAVSMGEAVPAEYGALIASELGLDKAAEEPAVTKAATGITALVVGAGASGIAAGIQLSKAGIDYRIIERNQGVGGTWLDNRYPGVGVDTPSHLYSFSFAPHDWPHYFSKGPDIRRYLEKVAADYGVVPHVTFGATVVEARFDAEAGLWRTKVLLADGREEEIATNLLFSGVGALNVPKVPNIEGLDTFAGPKFHTARWPEDLDLTGKRVGIIGTGASAMQIVPAIASKVAELTVFQRTPQWATPFDKLDVRVPEAMQHLMREVPLYRLWYRVRLGWNFNDRTYESLQKDPTWPHPERSLNPINDGHRRSFTRYIEREVGDRQDLLPAMVPAYPPFGKRILLDHGWFRTFRRENTHLVTEGVARVTAGGVVTADGIEHPLDVLVLSTGFDVVRFVSSFSVIGKAGRSLRDVWEDDNPRAYLGTVVPGFPNFFTLYGPNLQLGHGGSLLFMLECQLHYIGSLLTETFGRGARVFEVRQDVHDSYNEVVDAANERMIWTHPGVTNYYRNKRGRVVVNMALRLVDYWHRVRKANPADYDFS
ncbi:NAD(P)/FAD-dependent oxidoreductase [Microbacterium sp. BWT-B31]|uniref:flavin-containing monooxygenase n=1 Tax=Microbacterium sp. BWT-B31 TaxID=3232072 RepID=UPI003528739B